MSLTDFSTVPVVDVGGLLGDDPGEHRRVAHELGRAAREVGFLYVTNTGVDPALFADLLRVTQAFFDLPLAQKMATYIGRSTNHRGYVPVGEEVFSGGSVDLKEAFDLAQELPDDDPDYLRGRMVGPNQWPDLPGFQAACTAYYEAVLDLGRSLLRGFALALGEPAQVLQLDVEQQRQLAQSRNGGQRQRGQPRFRLGTHWQLKAVAPDLRRLFAGFESSVENVSVDNDGSEFVARKVAEIVARSLPQAD